jgi:hypothetical protein
LADLKKEKALIEKGLAASGDRAKELCSRIGQTCASRSPTWVKKKLAAIAEAQAKIVAKVNVANAIVADPAEAAYERRLKLLRTQAQAGDAKAQKEAAEETKKMFQGSKEYAAVAQRFKKPEASPEYVKLEAKKQRLRKFMAAVMPKYQRIADGASAYSRLIANV